MVSSNQAFNTDTQDVYPDSNEQLDREITLFQQTEFEEHKADCLNRNGIVTTMPSPSASVLWRRGVEKWGSDWLDRDTRLRVELNKTRLVACS